MAVSKESARGALTQLTSFHPLKTYVNLQHGQDSTVSINFRS